MVPMREEKDTYLYVGLKANIHTKYRYLSTLGGQHAIEKKYILVGRLAFNAKYRYFGFDDALVRAAWSV